MKRNMALVSIIGALLLFEPGGPLYAQTGVTEYKVAVDGQSYGPYDLDTLKKMVQEGTLAGNTHVWKAGMPEWVRSETIPEIAALIASVPREYKVAVDGMSYGPYGLDTLKELAQKGTLTESTHVWKAGMPEWVRSDTVPEIAALIASVPREYKVAVDGQSYGPYGLGTLKELAQKGTLTESTYVWKAGMPEWVRSETVPEIAAFFVPAPPAEDKAEVSQPAETFSEIAAFFVPALPAKDKAEVSQPAGTFSEIVTFFVPALPAKDKVTVSQAVELALYQSDIRLEYVPTFNGNNKFSGYNLFVRKKPGMESVLLTEPKGEYVLRAAEWNSVNGDEIRYVDGEPLTDEDVRYSIVSSTPVRDREFGSAFKLFVPDTLVYGNRLNGITKVNTQNGLDINLRTFSSKNTDYMRGRFHNNLFSIMAADTGRTDYTPLLSREPVPDYFNRDDTDAGGYQQEIMPEQPIRNFYQEGLAIQQLEAPGLSIAHPSLPVGTQVRVTNRQNDQAVIAAVVGRIPASAGHIADLSREAASSIGMGDSDSLHIILEIVDNRQ